MLRRSPLAIAVLALLALQARPAQACSGPRSANTAEERIAGRTDLRRVTGTYRIEGVGEPAANGQAMIRGQVTTRRGAVFRTVQPYRRIWVDCLIYYLPIGDASGTFYLSRRSRDDTYELIDWSGEYIAGNVIETEEGPQ